MSRATATKNLPHAIIRASAGSGKTFQLTNRYLELARRGVPLERILATTFTRKAAGEILARVLTRLAAAADDAKERELLAAFIAQDARFDRESCLRLLAYLATHLHRLRIGTLDSLFGQMARAFGLELNLPPGWSIADEAEQQALRTDAIAELLAAQETGDATRMVHLLAKGSSEQSVVRLVDQAVRELFGLFQETTREAWHRLPHQRSLDERGLEAALGALAAAGLPADKRAIPAREKDHAAAVRGEWEEFLKKGLTAKVVEGETTYYKKELPPDLVAVYQTLIDHAAAVLVNRVAAQNEGTYELLARFDEHFRRLQQSRRLLRFEDITRRLGEWTEELTGGPGGAARELELLAYRLDARIDHLLLDEFQDTSLSQWRVLRPLARHVTSAGARRESELPPSFFCVGDPKQAIYGWRGGLAEIFDSLDAELTNLSPQELNQSRRSSPAVIETVNRVFQRSSRLLNVERGGSAFRAWCEKFPRHETARTGLPGYVTLETPPEEELIEEPFVPGDEQRDVNDGEEVTADDNALFSYAARRVQELTREAPGRSIGVLMRSNGGIAAMIHRLRKLDVPASEEGGNPPTDSAAVRLFVSALRFADHPGDRIAAFHLVHSPLAEELGLRATFDDRGLAAASDRLRRELAERGYGVIFERWQEILSPYVSPRDGRRLEQVTELAFRRHGDTTLRPSDFVELLELTRMPDPSMVDVRVTTIHQSKGLEYDIVVLPELKTRLCGQPRSIVAGRSRKGGEIDTVCRYVSQSIQPLLPRRFQELFEESENAAVEESLCVLYVALTRAVHALHMIVASSKESEKKLPETMAGMLRAGLTDGRPLRPGERAFEEGDRDWASRLPARPAAPPESRKDERPSGERPSPTKPTDSRKPKASASTTVPPSVVAAASTAGQATGPAPLRLAERTGPRRRGLDRVAPSTLEGGHVRRMADRPSGGASRGQQRGTLLHAWCERIAWSDAGLPDDQELRSVALRTQDLAWSEREMSELLREFRRALAAPAIEAALRRDAYGADDVELLREQRFAVRKGDELLSGAVDRLVLTRRQGRVVAAEILDFKTDALPAGDERAIAERVEFYAPQLRAYRTAVALTYGLPDERITSKLLLLSIGECRTVH